MSKRMIISVAAVALVVAVMVVAIAISAARVTPGSQAKAVAGSSPSSAAAKGLPPARARTLERELRSGDQKQVMDAIAIPAGQVLDPGLLAGLAQMRSVALDASSFVTPDGRTGQMSAVVVDPQDKSAHWTVYLTVAGGIWKVVATNLADA
jgi:hypothetical protein